jgi:hypothetical protein
MLGTGLFGGFHCGWSFQKRLAEITGVGIRGGNSSVMVQPISKRKANQENFPILSD